MHPVRIGRIVRSLRRRLGWRQVDLAKRAGVSQQAVSLAETGQARRVSLATLERILGALEAEVEILVRWRGGELDRIVDAAHAELVVAIAELLTALGWMVHLEVTYAIGRERGSIDLLAFHPVARTVLVVEVKVDMTSAESTLRRHDEKVRLARRIAQDRFEWDAPSVSRLLVLPDASTPRRRIAAHAALFHRMYPMRGREARRWLRRPDGPSAAIMFLSVTNRVGDRRGQGSRRRIQRPRETQTPVDPRSTARLRAPGFIDSTGEHQAEW